MPRRCRLSSSLSSRLPSKYKSASRSRFNPARLGTPPAGAAGAAHAAVAKARRRKAVLFSADVAMVVKALCSRQRALLGAGRGWAVYDT